MATANNTIKTRVQLKSDTEANWNSHPMVPLSGELIIYSADTTHNYSRLKVGDGVTSVANLPFIDAGTLNGVGLPANVIATYPTRTNFPYPGTEGVLYIDLTNGRIYCYSSSSGYTQLSNFTYNVSKTSVSNITYWRAGTQSTYTSEGGTLKINTGLLPSLLYEDVLVVQDITKEGTE